MALEISNVALQTVAPQANVLFAETPVRDCRGQIVHREGSGIVTLRGAPNCARYKVSFGANVAIPTGGTVGPISLAITLDGEPLGSATMIVTMESMPLLSFPSLAFVSSSKRSRSTVAISLSQGSFP